MPRGRRGLHIEAALLEAALIGFEQMGRQVDEKIAKLRRRVGSRSGAGVQSADALARPKRKLSAAARRRIAAAQRKRWAAAKAKAQAKPAAPKRTMSAAARKKIAAAQRKRWAAVKKAQAKAAKASS